MTASPFTCVLDARASLGECPLWSSDERALYWVDINAPSLNRFDPATGENRVMPMPASIGSFVFREAGGFVVALRNGIFVADAYGTILDRLAAAPYETAHHRFNDGRCDPQGRFVVGAMNERRDAADAGLYRIDGAGRLEELFGGLTISNGLAWSPDGRTMYHADTPTRSIRRFDYVADGRPSNPRVLVAFDGETERPDGGAVDSAGNYWTALYRGGDVRQFSPRGELLARHAVPAMCPTMCAFGGDDLRTLYVTTARQQREPDELARLPQSGGIFAMRVEVPGLPEARFR
jgi:sugar lactone lactonase YvrE